ncbi:MAG: hypothetical protein IJ272_05005 [Clostridia bacterium]|nr:hypothetical protein [Clostridia bacterium]
MLKITDKYYLGSNKNTLTLYQKKTNEQTKKETFKSVGYFTSLDGLYASLIEKEIKENLELLTNIEKIQQLVEELKTFTISYNSGEKAV